MLTNLLKPSAVKKQSQEQNALAGKFHQYAYARYDGSLFFVYQVPLLYFLNSLLVNITCLARLIWKPRCKFATKHNKRRSFLLDLATGLVLGGT